MKYGDSSPSSSLALPADENDESVQLYAHVRFRIYCAHEVRVVG